MLVLSIDHWQHCSLGLGAVRRQRVVAAVHQQVRHARRLGLQHLRVAHLRHGGVVVPDPADLPVVGVREVVPLDGLHSLVVHHREQLVGPLLRRVLQFG